MLTWRDALFIRSTVASEWQDRKCPPARNDHRARHRVSNVCLTAAARPSENFLGLEQTVPMYGYAAIAAHPTCPSCLPIRLCRPHPDIRRHRHFSMNNQSRSAAREGFAHQRARLLFSARPNTVPPVVGRAQRAKPNRRSDIVRDGLIGFLPSGRL